MLNTLIAGFELPHHKLILKADFTVVLLRNVDPFGGHVNGARYILKAVRRKLLMWESLTDDNTGKNHALPKMPCGPGDSSLSIGGFRRTLFSVRVCFATTIIKA